VIGRSAGVVVKVGDSTIKLTSMAKVEQGKVMTPFVPKFKIGTRFNPVNQ